MAIGAWEGKKGEEVFVWVGWGGVVYKPTISQSNLRTNQTQGIILLDNQTRKILL